LVKRLLVEKDIGIIVFLVEAVLHLLDAADDAVQVRVAS